MVTGSVSNANTLYVPFPHQFLVEDAPQSSEDGSGLHSPTFMDSDSSIDGHRRDFQTQPHDLDLQGVGELLMTPHFTHVEQHHASSLSAYATQPHSHAGNNIHYATYSHPGVLRSFNDDRRYIHRDPPQSAYDNVSAIIPTSTTHLPQNRVPTNKLIEISRPLTLPSLLPATSSIPNLRISSRSIEADRLSAASIAVGTRPEKPSPHSHSLPKEQESKIYDSRQVHDVTTGGTTQHTKREPSLVVIACQQCRARKIRCDSNRPSCNNCIRRQNECQYDAVPKRRGPDKRPGTRQRSCKKRPVDGSIPVKRKQRKSNVHDAASSTTQTLTDGRGMDVSTSVDNHASIMKTKTGSCAPTSAGGLSMPGDMAVGSTLGLSPTMGLANAGAERGFGGYGKSSSIGLRQDMNFIERSSQGFDASRIIGAESHARTRSAPSSEPFHFLPSATTQTTAFSSNPYCARQDPVHPKSDGLSSPSFEMNPFLRTSN